MELDSFQKSTQQKLNDLLEMKGWFARFGIEGRPREFAVVSHFGNYESWIYPDGAGVLGGQIDKRCEIDDFDSLADLQHEDIRFVGELLTA